VLTALAIYHRKVIYAAPPDEALPDHIGQTVEVLIVGAINVAVGLTSWGMIRKYTGAGPAADLIPPAQAQGVSTAR
jgi:hypothetical protein